MIVFSNAKINIGLNIVSKRPDGYHNLETVFYPINMCDVIEFTENEDSDNLCFSSNGISLDCAASDNLVVKAYNLLKKDFDIPAQIIDLVKNIPTGAGLGGGSGDATFTLKYLNDRYSLGLDSEKLKSYASLLGADCAFFVENRPVYATGIGDVMEPVELSLKGYYIAVVKPDIFISTREAFAGITLRESEVCLKELVHLPVSEWKNCIKNDFEYSIFPNHKMLQNVKCKLYDIGAEYVSMSGSGSSIYGLFKKNPEIFEQNFDNCYIWSSQCLS